MDLYTFGLRYPSGDVEEIDVHADSARAAVLGATIVAHADYAPGWTMIELPPGGSSGTLSIFNFSE